MNKYKVELLAFGDEEEIREVSIPEGVEESLDNVYHYGQNDVQPLQHPSVSVGDVINMNGRKFVIMAFGFRDLSEDEYEKYLATPRRNRIPFLNDLRD